MSDRLPPMEEGEANVLRAMEARTASSRSSASNGPKPTIYDALHDSSQQGDKGKPKTKPSFARLVRKIMSEKHQVESGVEPKTGGGHSRSRSNAHVYHLLKKMKDNKSEPSLDDVFQQDIFHQDSPAAVSGDLTESEDAEREDLNPGSVVDVEQVPVDTTPLLQNDEAAVRRLKELKQVKSMFNGTAIKTFLWGLLSHCWLLVFSAILAALALVLYYHWSNPSLDALPGNATLAWWCNFLARQIVLFEVARVIKFILLDCIILGGSFSVKIIGPFVTLLALQAKDWPFVLAVWGILDACLLHGDDPFQNHWLYATGWKIYSMQADSGLYIMASEPYLRLLVCMIVAGTATALKRTFLAISFGRRQYSTFKPRLEKLLLDVVLLNEVASLSAHAESMHEEISATASQQQTGVKKTKRSGLQDVTWSSVKMQEEEEPYGSGGADEANKRGYGRSSSGSLFLKQLLDRWEEPLRTDKTEATIEDVLRFRRALAFMDETYPFGEDFGIASTRDEAILSAEAVYHKLCKITTRGGRLPFETLALIALEDDDSHDQVKERAVRRLFHPDKDGVLSLLAFVQSCDSLYRRLRYFLATVNNSASLDKVLENVLNSLYYFVLVLLLLSLMNYNAWSLLLSMTSLLVSFSFAFGATVSKYVQGIILIAVTRPFDLGDRIFLTSAGDVEKGLENAANGWFVEDITLSATKLRFARTGEVAYLANNLLADMRIYNCNRSPNASVVLQHMLHIAVLDKDNLKKFEEALRKFVDERPRMWVELLIVCVVRIDPDMEQVFLNIAFRHRDSWQSCPRIYLHRAELLQYIQDVSKRLGIVFESPPPSRVLYYAGHLDKGAAARVEDDYRKDLLRPQNVRSSSSHLTHERGTSVGSTSSLPPPLNQMGA